MKKLTILSVVVASMLLVGCGGDTKEAVAENTSKVEKTAVEKATEAVKETASKVAKKTEEVAKEAKKVATDAVEKGKEVAKEAKDAVVEKATAI